MADGGHVEKNYLVEIIVYFDFFIVAIFPRLHHVTGMLLF